MKVIHSYRTNRKGGIMRRLRKIEHRLKDIKAMMEENGLPEEALLPDAPREGGFNKTSLAMLDMFDKYPHLRSGMVPDEPMLPDPPEEKFPLFEFPLGRSVFIKTEEQFPPVEFVVVSRSKDHIQLIRVVGKQEKLSFTSLHIIFDPENGD